MEFDVLMTGSSEESVGAIRRWGPIALGIIGVELVASVTGLFLTLAYVVVGWGAIDLGLLTDTAGIIAPEFLLPVVSLLGAVSFDFAVMVEGWSGIKWGIVTGAYAVGVWAVLRFDGVLAERRGDSDAS